MPRKRTPDDRNSVLENGRREVRRKYRSSKQIKKSRKIALGEQGHLENMTIILKIAGYTNTQIGQIVNLSRGQVKKLLAEPNVAEQMASLLEALPAAALDLMQSYSIEAVQTIADVMRTSPEWKARMEAAREILDRTGLPKVTKSEAQVYRTEEHLTTFSNDGIIEALRNASPEVQETAAQMMEGIENLLAQHGEEIADEESDDDS